MKILNTVIPQFFVMSSTIEKDQSFPLVYASSISVQKRVQKWHFSYQSMYQEIDILERRYTEARSLKKGYRFCKATSSLFLSITIMTLFKETRNTCCLSWPLYRYHIFHARIQTCRHENLKALGSHRSTCMDTGNSQSCRFP